MGVYNSVESRPFFQSLLEGSESGHDVVLLNAPGRAWCHGLLSSSAPLCVVLEGRKLAALDSRQFVGRFRGSRGSTTGHIGVSCLVGCQSWCAVGRL